MNTTQILGEAPGIQYQKKTDKTETKTNQSLTDTIIIGRFKRGRFDMPMTIHNGNIRGQLGYDPKIQITFVFKNVLIVMFLRFRYYVFRLILGN